MKAPLRVALLPMTSTDSVGVNTQNILEALAKITTPVDIVFLPENSLYFNFNKKLKFALQGSADMEPLIQWCRTHSTALHLGGVPYKTQAGVCNTSLFIDANGAVKELYNKIHLFDVDVAGRTVRESDNFVAGGAPAILDYKGWRIGLTICYDLRFAELFVHYHKQKVDVIVVPSSFLVETGRAHWNTLLRARAIETQAYVLAPAQGGTHHSTLDPSLAEKNTWGETLAIGPWGEVLARSSSFDEMAVDNSPLVLELGDDDIEKVRGQIPMLFHRKLHI